MLARTLVKGSYKSDDRQKQNPARAEARRAIVAALERGRTPLGLTLESPSTLLHALQEDASGDSLDAVLANVKTRRQRIWEECNVLSNR